MGLNFKFSIRQLRCMATQVEFRENHTILYQSAKVLPHAMFYETMLRDCKISALFNEKEQNFCVLPPDLSVHSRQIVQSCRGKTAFFLRWPALLAIFFSVRAKFPLRSRNYFARKLSWAARNTCAQALACMRVLVREQKWWHFINH